MILNGSIRRRPPFPDADGILINVRSRTLLPFTQNPTFRCHPRTCQAPESVKTIGRKTHDLETIVFDAWI